MKCYLIMFFWCWDLCNVHLKHCAWSHAALIDLYTHMHTSFMVFFTSSTDRFAINSTRISLCQCHHRGTHIWWLVVIFRANIKIPSQGSLKTKTPMSTNDHLSSRQKLYLGDVTFQHLEIPLFTSTFECNVMCVFCLTSVVPLSKNCGEMLVFWQNEECFDCVCWLANMHLSLLVVLVVLAVAMVIAANDAWYSWQYLLLHLCTVCFSRMVNNHLAVLTLLTVMVMVQVLLSLFEPTSKKTESRPLLGSPGQT